MFEPARERHAADLAYAHDLTLPQSRLLSDLAIHALVPDANPDAGAHLRDPDVAEAFISPLGPTDDDGTAERLVRVAELALARGHDTAGAHYVLAAVAEARGDIDVQRRHLEASLERDATFWPARLALGFLAFVAGDARRAGPLLACLHDPRAVRMAHTLTHYPPVGLPVGRNDSCPCGSGRKAKHCCPPGHPLERRALWLWEKAEQWLRRLPQMAGQVRLAEELADVARGEETEEVLDVLEDDDFQSVALLDGGMLAGFLDTHGDLLPDDERDLATSWLGVRHRVWDVEATEPGEWLRLRDRSTGATVQAVNGSASRCTQASEIVFGAVVPTGDGWLLPNHPVCLYPDEGDAVAELVCAGIDPLAVAATVYRGGASATM